MTYSMNNQKVLVTGGGSGMGRAIALLFARCGASVYIIGRTEAKLRETIAEGKKENLSICMSTCDVSNFEKVDKLIDEYEKNNIIFDIVINAAGVINVCNKDGSQNNHAPMDVNYWGTFYVCERVIASMMKYNIRGTLINIASIAGINGSGRFLTYSASKGAVISYTKGLARMYGKHGIRVNAISPGCIVTPMSYVETPNFDERIDERICEHPLRKLGKPEDIANCALFLASDFSSFITGQNIIVDGGLTI